MKKLFSQILALFLMFYILPLTSYIRAQYGQYGGEAPSYSIVVDKMVSNPQTTKGGSLQYVDNLIPSDPRFASGQDVWFKIKIKNTSNINLQAVEVKDYVPEFILPLEGPGKWYPDTRTIVWNAGDFNIDEEKTYYLKMRVYDQSLLPADKGLFCLINKVEVKNNVVYDDDTAQFCIEKQVIGVQKVPSAGPEMGLALLAGNLLLAGVGIRLKNTKISHK